MIFRVGFLCVCVKIYSIAVQCPNISRIYYSKHSHICTRRCQKKKKGKFLYTKILLFFWECSLLTYRFVSVDDFYFVLKKIESKIFNNTVRLLKKFICLNGINKQIAFLTTITKSPIISLENAHHQTHTEESSFLSQFWTEYKFRGNRAAPNIQYL